MMNLWYDYATLERILIEIDCYSKMYYKVWPNKELITITAITQKNIMCLHEKYFGLVSKNNESSFIISFCLNRSEKM